MSESLPNYDSWKTRNYGEDGSSEPRVAFRCDECKAEIYEGDDYYEICGYCFCEECIEKCRKEAETEEGE